MAQNALPLTSHHVKNFTTALKRVHPAVGKAVCVMCQCLDNQVELGQFAESGGMLVLDIVKHAGAGIASVLPLGVMKLAALICSLLPENDRTTGIDWLVNAHAAFNVVHKIWVNRSALEGFLGIRSKHVVALLAEAQQVLSERNLKVSNDIDLLKAHRVFKSMPEILAGADAAKEGVDDWNELWANAIVKTQNMPRNFDAEPKTEDEWAAFVKMKAATLSMCTVHALKDICHKRGWHADASDSRETLIDKVTTNLLADAK